MSACKKNGSLPPPQPKSPPRYPDLYGKRRELARVQMLEREIGFLEEELKSVERIPPASRTCKEVDDFVTANVDPLIPTIKKTRTSCRFWKWLCGVCCFDVVSWTCCCSCSLDVGLPRCSSDCTTCSCCRIPKWQCCSSQCFKKWKCNWWWCCCGMPQKERGCPSCPTCSCTSCICDSKNMCSCCCHKSSCCCFPCYYCI